MRLKIEGKQTREVLLERIDSLLKMLEKNGAVQFSGINVYLTGYDDQDNPWRLIVNDEAIETVINKPNKPTKASAKPLVTRQQPKLRAVS